MNPTDTTATVVHESAPGSGGLFSLDPGVMIWTWVVFGLLLVVLRKYAWTPLINSVAEREKVIAGAVENARRTQEELQKVAQRQKELLDEASEQARQIVQSGRSAADQVAEQIVQKAHKEAQDKLEQGKLQLQQEKDRALDDLKRQTVDLVIQASQKLIEQSLTEEQRRQIVEQGLKNI